MILQATIPTRPASDVDETCCVDSGCQWNGGTTGSVIEMDAAQFGQELRRSLDQELQNARHSWSGDAREGLARTPRFRNQAVLTLWLDQQIKAGKAIVELSDFPCVAEYPDHWNDLLFANSPGLSRGGWSSCLARASCPICGISYGVGDLTEIEHDRFFYGEYVLACPRSHQLIVVGSEMYQLGG